MRFRLLEGIHYELNANPSDENPERDVQFEKGATVESPIELDKKWKNKFQRIIEEKPHEVMDARRRAVSVLIEKGKWDEEDRQSLENLPDPAFDLIWSKDAMPRRKAKEPLEPEKAPLEPVVADKPAVASESPPKPTNPPSKGKRGE